MIHLPKNGTRVKVWPDPKRKVAAMAPRADAMFMPDMAADGATVLWDEFRYHQYLAGDIHLFDPETGAGESYDFEHPTHEHNLEYAAKHWKCERGERARQHLEHIAKVKAEREQSAAEEKAKAEAEQKAAEIASKKGAAAASSSPDLIK
jgi:hypothetical protein